MMRYTALLALPDGGMATDAAARIPNAEVIDNKGAGVWIHWMTHAESDAEAIAELQEMRLRAEMLPEYAHGGETPSGANPSLFQSTPFIIVRDGLCTTVVHSEEVFCI